MPPSEDSVPSEQHHRQDVKPEQIERTIVSQSSTQQHH